MAASQLLDAGSRVAGRAFRGARQACGSGTLRRALPGQRDRAVDYWVYVDPETMQARLSVEGWGTPDQTLGLSGIASVDGRLLSTAFAAVLRMPHPDHT